MIAFTRVHGGLLNRMWRLDTDNGSFAVKQLTADRGWTYRFDDVFRFERAAFAASIPMPEPIAANETMLVHRWVEGDKVPHEPVSPALAHEIGMILARVHGLDVPWSHVSIEDPMPTEDEWRALAERAVDQPWAPELSAAVPAFGAIGRFVDAAGRPEPIVLTHKDLSQKNLLVRDGRPIVLDWEVTGKMPVSMELGSTALRLAAGDLLDSLRPAVFQAVLDGYVDAGGVLPAPGAHWFADHLGGWTWFTRWNIERCVTGVEPSSGPSLALSHETVRAALHGLPAALAGLDRLADLTAR